MSFQPELMRAEFVGAEFGDARLSQRLVALSSALAVTPERSLPRSIGDRAQVEAAYRFLSNSRVTMRAILEPHFAQTRARVANHRVVLAVHDTTTIEYDGDRSDLGPLGGQEHRGYLLHATLAVTADARREPLGVYAARTWARPEKKRPKTAPGRTLGGSDYAKIADKESSRWLAQIEETEERNDDVAQLIHVLDREGDAFPLLKSLVEKQRRFVIRASRDRRIEDDEEDARRLGEACALAQHVIEYDVPIAPRTASKAPRAAKTHETRDTRRARLAVCALRVALVPPAYMGVGEPLDINVVYVRELDAPDQTSPLQWVLYTSESIDTVEQLLAVIHFYRGRWRVEELFKALKTGCQIQKLQLESYDALTNALGIYLPIAWTCLALRSVADARPNAPATDVLNPTQLAVLRRFSSYKLSQHPSVRDALMAVACLGGYMPHRKPPGWLTLARGMEDLLRFELVWDAAKTDLNALDR